MESNSTLKSTGNSIHRLKKENYSTTQGNYYNRVKIRTHFLDI